MDTTFSDDPTPVDWDRLSLIFKRAPLGDRDAAGLREVFQNSGVRCFAYHGSELIGAGRAITDRVRYAVIFDVVLLPEHQGRGIGQEDHELSYREIESRECAASCRSRKTDVLPEAWLSDDEDRDGTIRES